VTWIIKEGIKARTSRSASPTRQITIPVSAVSMEVGEYEARRNARVAAHRLELGKLLQASAFLNRTWDRHLLGHASEEDSQGRVHTKGGADRSGGVCRHCSRQDEAHEKCPPRLCTTRIYYATAATQRILRKTRFECLSRGSFASLFTFIVILLLFCGSRVVLFRSLSTNFLCQLLLVLSATATRFYF
jgi:hypothetical protein